MTLTPCVPALLVRGRRWSADEIEARAVHWRDCLVSAVGEHGRLAVAAGADADGAALVMAAAARPGWFSVLPPDARFWPRLELPPQLTVALPPSLAALTPAVEAVGAAALVLPDGTRHSGDGLELLRSDGIVVFTSGSTGTPKPVFRPMPALLAGIRMRLAVLGLQGGEGIVAGVPFGHGHGLTRLLSAMCLGGTFALLDPLDHRGALAVLADPQYGLWSATAHFADVLGRCRLTGPAAVPRVCLISSTVSRPVGERFQERFAVPLRQNYSSSETGSIAVDAATASDVRPETVGRPLPGVDVRIDAEIEVDMPQLDDAAGRIWVRSPWLMAGYGFPPVLERPGETDGWWPTRDVGHLRPDGRLLLVGRVDDCIRTREGRLVNLGDIARRLREVSGVDDAAVVPMAGAAGASFGAVVACSSSERAGELRRRISSTLPDWAWPRAIVQVARIPRLMTGKLDREQCAALLSGGR